MVNRVWKHHFGTGLVATPGNFGKAGAAPTHPKLLDWLAVDFIARGWSLKALHRLMVTSSTYRQSSVVSDLARIHDPDNTLHSRHNLLRMEAEVLQDSMLKVAGRLDPSPFGPPDTLTARADGLMTPKEGPNGWRRAIYVRQDRKSVSTLLEVFDLPQMNPNCIERRNSNVAPQALHLWNDGLVRKLAEQFARRVASEAGAEPDRQVDQAFLLALGRPPIWRNAPSRSYRSPNSRRWTRGSIKRGNRERSHRALTALCHAIFNSAAFLYID